MQSMSPVFEAGWDPHPDAFQSGGRTPNRTGLASFSGRPGPLALPYVHEMAGSKGIEPFGPSRDPSG